MTKLFEAKQNQKCINPH